jgi:Haem-NO-binding
MLGNIFFLLQKFLQKELGTASWNRVFAEAGLAPRMYLPEENYPDEEAIGMLQAAGRLTGRPVPEVVESFGYAIAPELLGLFRSLISPEYVLGADAVPG